MFSIDLKPYFNHRFVYPEKTVIKKDEMIGINNNFFFREFFPFNRKLKAEDMEAVFEKNENDQDNIGCERQIINIAGISAEKILFAGFCSWGVYKEIFEIVFDDGTSEYISVQFSDVTFPSIFATVRQLVLQEKDIKKASRILFGPCKLKKEQGYIYYNIFKLKQRNKKIVKLIFPDNYFMSIWAISIK